MILDVVSVALVLFAGIDWVATVILVRAARSHTSPALSERALVSVVLSTIAAGAALLALNRLIGLNLPNGVAIVILSGGLLAVSVPQLVWVGLYFKGRFA